MGLTRISTGSTLGPMTTTKTTVKRRKPKSGRKEESLRLRLTSAQKETFTAAADRAGLDLSNWLRFIATREAERTAGG
jgi:hypothetical protein